MAVMVYTSWANACIMLARWSDDSLAWQYYSCL